MKLLSLPFVFLILSVSFGFQEEEVELVAKGCTLKGTLTTQDDPSVSTTLVILIAGSGPTDRNGNNPQMKNNSLRYLSNMLACDTTNGPLLKVPLKILIKRNFHLMISFLMPLVG